MSELLVTKGIRYCFTTITNMSSIHSVSLQVLFVYCYILTWLYPTPTAAMEPLMNEVSIEASPLL